MSTKSWPFRKLKSLGPGIPEVDIEHLDLPAPTRICPVCGANQERLGPDAKAEPRECAVCSGPGGEIGGGK